MIEITVIVIIIPKSPYLSQPAGGAAVLSSARAPLTARPGLEWLAWSSSRSSRRARPHSTMTHEPLLMPLPLTLLLNEMMMMMMMGGFGYAPISYMGSNRAWRKSETDCTCSDRQYKFITRTARVQRYPVHIVHVSWKLFNSDRLAD